MVKQPLQARLLVAANPLTEGQVRDATTTAGQNGIARFLVVMRLAKAHFDLCIH